MKIQIYFETSSEGGYTCFVPSFGCISEGNTKEEVKKQLCLPKHFLLSSKGFAFSSKSFLINL